MVDELLFLKLGGCLAPALLSYLSPDTSRRLAKSGKFVQLSSIPCDEHGTKIIEWLRLHRLGDS